VRRNEQDNLRVRAQIGYADARMMELPFDIEKAYAGHAFHENARSYHDSQAEYETLFDHKMEEATRFRVRSYAPARKRRSHWRDLIG